MDSSVFLPMRDLESLSDEALAERAARGTGDPDAREAASVLFARYSGRIYQWARRYTRDHERALDLAQDVMLSAWDHIGSYEPKARFFAWLFVITRNKCLNALRRPPLVVDEEVEIDSLPAQQRTPDEAWEEGLAEDEILTLIREELDREEQDVLYLRCFERMSVDEIGTALRLSGASGARGVLQRARRKLRAATEERRGGRRGSFGLEGPARSDIP